MCGFPVRTSTSDPRWKTSIRTRIAAGQNAEVDRVGRSSVVSGMAILRREVNVAPPMYFQRIHCSVCAFTMIAKALTRTRRVLAFRYHMLGEVIVGPRPP